MHKAFGLLGIMAVGFAFCIPTSATAANTDSDTGTFQTRNLISCMQTSQ